MNKIIKTLIFSDLVLNSALGLTAPIFAIFIVDKIHGGDVAVVGIAVGIFWLLKSAIQIPIGQYLDRNHGEKDDFYFMFFGTLIASAASFGFLVSSQPWHIYLFQILRALGLAMAIPSWAGIFTRHIDKGREALTWSVESSAVGIGAGLTGIVGGVLAKSFGFDLLFWGSGILGIISAVVFLCIKDQMIPRGKLSDVHDGKRHSIPI